MRLWGGFNLRIRSECATFAWAKRPQTRKKTAAARSHGLILDVQNWTRLLSQPHVAEHILPVYAKLNPSSMPAIAGEACKIFMSRTHDFARFLCLEHMIFQASCSWFTAPTVRFMLSASVPALLLGFSSWMIHSKLELRFQWSFGRNRFSNY